MGRLGTGLDITMHLKVFDWKLDYLLDPYTLQIRMKLIIHLYSSLKVVKRYIIISYSWKQQNIVKILAQQLRKNKNRYKVWLDLDHMAGDTVTVMSNQSKTQRGFLCVYPKHRSNHIIVY